MEKIEELEAILRVADEKDEKAKMKVANAYLEIFELRRFAFLNYVAVTKAVKKRNKSLKRAIDEGRVVATSTLSMLMHQNFFSNLRFEHLVRAAYESSLAPQEIVTLSTEFRRRVAENLEGAGIPRPLPQLSAPLTTRRSDPKTELGRLTVVLDLDQTMIFSMSKRSKLMLSRDCHDNLDNLFFWDIQMSHVPYPAKVFIRPGLKDFLLSLAAIPNLQMVVFTAGIEPYAKPIIDQIEAYAGVTFARRLYRDSTARTPQYSTVKDLTCLGLDLARVILLDDNPLSYSLQPFNGVPVMPFTPLVSEGETYLNQMLLPVVRDLTHRADVRLFLRTKYNMHAWFAKCGVDVPSEDEAGEGEGAAAGQERVSDRVSASPWLARSNSNVITIG